jgi:hypothetical protein
MKREMILMASLALVAAAPLPAMAADEPVQAATIAAEAPLPEASIPFANSGGIRDWKDGEDGVVYFQDRQRKWYRAELQTPATGIGFVQFIGVEAGPTGSLDRWSMLSIDGQRYAIRSFTRLEGEPPKRTKS